MTQNNYQTVLSVIQDLSKVHHHDGFMFKMEIGYTGLDGEIRIFGYPDTFYFSMLPEDLQKTLLTNPKRFMPEFWNCTPAEFQAWNEYRMYPLCEAIKANGERCMNSVASDKIADNPIEFEDYRPYYCSIHQRKGS